MQDTVIHQQDYVLVISGDMTQIVQVRFWTNSNKVLPFKLGLVAVPVIEAIARLEFEDAMRTGVLPGGCWGP